LPTRIKQMFRYGKHSLKGEQSDKLVSKIEIPKAWFGHFYVFAFVWSWSAVTAAVAIYFFDYEPHEYLIKYLDFSCGDNRQAESE
jgi:3-oxo-5-alpha-steroid 4-dehydrogenase 3